MNISYDYYKIFYYVGKNGSFTKAARELGASQPNITRAMNNLESQLGQILFVRSKRGITLTEEGKRLYAHIEKGIKQFFAAETEMKHLKELKVGHISIGVSEIALHEVLLPILKQYREEHPAIYLQISNDSTQAAINSVIRGENDFALVTTPIPAGHNLTCINLCPVTEHLYAGINDLSLKEGSHTLTQLMEYPWISLSTGTSTRKHHEMLFSERGLLFEPMIVTATMDQVLPMVKTGLGIGFIPDSMVPEMETEVYPVSVKEEIQQRYICLAYDGDQMISKASELLLNTIKRKFKVSKEE